MLRLANVEHRPVGILIQVHAGQGRKLARTFAKQFARVGDVRHGRGLDATGLYLNCGTRTFNQPWKDTIVRAHMRLFVSLWFDDAARNFDCSSRRPCPATDAAANSLPNSGTAESS